MFLLNDKPLPLDTPFSTEDGTQYPANWLRLTTLDEKIAIGITEVPDEERYDSRFYWSFGVPKDLDECKSSMLHQVKQTAGSLIAPTDWKVIRAIETGSAVDEDTLAFRAAIRAASNQNEAAIAACITVDELAAIQLTWPSNESSA